MLKLNPQGSFHDERYTMKGKPPKPTRLMKLYVWSRTFFPLWIRRHKYIKINMETVQEPYIMLASHGSYLDFKTAARAVFPKSAANVAALDAYVKYEKLLKWLGSIGVRKFSTQDSTVGRNMLHVIKKHGLTLIIYPEARYTLDGRAHYIPPSLGKLVKLAKVPVVTLINHGHHLAKPYWSKQGRFFKTESVLKQIITAEETHLLTPDAINERIQEAFVYDDYQWQKSKQLKIRHRKRAEGLENLLYRTYGTQHEGVLRSKGHQLFCEASEKRFELNEQGDLIELGDTPKVIAMATWVDWQKECLKASIEEGSYHVETEVDVYVLPNPKGFVSLGKGIFKHSPAGFEVHFQVEGEAMSWFHESKRQYAVHVAYKHHHGQPFIGFSHDNLTYFFGFDQSFPVTKVAFATELIYQSIKNGDARD